ncbi:hypothetical protein ACFWQ6_25930 [Streptomyces coelicoflavus]|uniref:hypothetical protein n=1 Tax=Streptomyces coelicoflavus TaxID=285562 RepID=UPI003666C293
MSGFTHFGHEADAALEQWQNTRRRITLADALPAGGSGARLGFVFHEGDAEHPQHKLLLKLCADDYGAITEPRDLETAWQSGPDFHRGGPAFAFPEHRLIRQVYPPLKVGDSWLMFLECALDARGRNPLVPLTMIPLGEGRTDVAAAVIESIFTEWNPDPRAEHDMAAQDFLAKALGHRADPASHLAVAAARLLGTDLRSTFFTPPGGSHALPNPTPFADPSPLARLKPPTVALGRAHYDLHPGNIMVARQPQLDPDSFRLIDLSRFQEEGLLLRDPVQLMLHLVCDYLPQLGEPARNVLEELLLNEDEESTAADEVLLPKGLLSIIRRLRAAPNPWRQVRRYAQPEWHPQYLLALQACALMFLPRRTEPVEQLWFLRLAARACAAFQARATRHTPRRPAPAPTQREDTSAADGPVAWAQWREQVPASGTPLALVTHECFSKPTIERNVERQAYRFMSNWLDQPSPHSGILKVEGARGSGRTWALLRSVDELHRLRQAPVFVLDPESGADITALHAFRTEQQQPFIIVLDALRDPDDVRVILSPALDGRDSSQPGLYLLTECDTPAWLLPLQQTVQAGRVQIDEVQALAAQLHPSRSRRHRLTHSERADINLRLRSDNPPLIGEVVRMLSSDREQAFQRYAEELHLQFQKYPSGTDKALGLLLLMYCGSQRLPVPDGVLSEAFGLASDDLEQTHGYVVGAGERLVWLGQRTALDRALKRIRNRNGNPTFEKWRHGFLHKTLRGIDPTNRLHQKFVRELINRASKEDRSWLASNHRNLILSIATKSGQEPVSNQIYAWYPLILAIHRSDGETLPDVRSLADDWQAGLSDELAQNLAPQPRSPAEVLHMLLTLGGDETMLHLVGRLRGASEWDANPWAEFFEMVEKFPRKTEITNMLMPVLRSGAVDVPHLLHTRNTAQLLPPLVTEYGRPDERTWLWRHLYNGVTDTDTASLQDRYKCAGQFLELTRRCLTQKRHDLSLRILKACVQSSILNDATCDAFEAELHVIHREEVNDALGARSTEALLYLACELPHNQAAHAWEWLLKIAHQWHPDELHRLSRMSLDTVGQLMKDPQVPVTDYGPLHFAALETAIHARTLRPSDAKNYLKAFPATPEDSQAELVVQLATAVIRSSDPADSSPVHRLLADLAVREAWESPTALSNCLDALADWAGTPAPAAALTLNPRTLKRLILALRLLQGDLGKQRSRIVRILQNYPEESQKMAYRHVISELLRVRLPDNVERHMQSSSTENPHDLCARAHAKALQGDLTAMRAFLRRLLRTYDRTGRGTHPTAMRELTKAMTEQTSGPEQRCYQLINRLQTLGLINS